MNGRRARLAVLAPVAVSSLAVGMVTFSAASARAASPDCGLAKTATPDILSVSGQDFKPNKQVALESGAGHEGAIKADASGAWTLQVSSAEGTITAQQIGGPEVKCGTVDQTEQKNAKAQYRQGFREGFADMKADCKSNPPQQAAPDPNWQQGFKDGSDVAAKRFC
ncbi:hypothetical protein ACF073_00600 [Streptomyces sp. NPDC015171]|uniref:hypothetical protein n=1 Tax=Streptomyces sp. NPDC015171 TaxID=3364945 RepID=UPI0036FAB256